MRAEGLDLCVYCMNPLEKKEICPHCGKNQKDYKKKPRHLLPGTKLAGRYILGSAIGEGSFGITYIGFDVILRQRLAIKEFYPVDLVNRDFLRGTEGKLYVYSKEALEEYKKRLNKFYLEAQNLSRFSELDAICSVRDFFRANGTAYLVMGYVDGISLKRLVEEHGPMEERRVLELMKPVMKSLAEIHRNGIIHRDISPDNLILDTHGRLILIDFGSARVESSRMMHTMTVIFKQGFSPLEQYRNHTEQGAYSDIYALCATMYYMLFGTPPDSAVERMISDGVPGIIEKEGKHLSERLKNGLKKGLAVEKEKRYQVMETLIKELYPVSGETGEYQKKILFLRKKRYLQTFVSVAALITILSGAFLLQGNFIEPEKQNKDVKRLENVLSSKKEKTEKTGDVRKTGVTVKTEVPVKTETPEKTEAPVKTEKPEKTEVPEKTEKTVKTKEPVQEPERRTQGSTTERSGQEKSPAQNRRTSYTPRPAPKPTAKPKAQTKAAATEKPDATPDFAGIIE